MKILVEKEWTASSCRPEPSLMDATLDTFVQPTVMPPFAVPSQQADSDHPAKPSVVSSLGTQLSSPAEGTDAADEGSDAFEQLTREAASNLSGPLRLVRYDRLEDAEPLLLLFERIAQEQNWKPEAELRSYGSAARHFALKVEGHTLGGLQLIVGNAEEGLPCLSVWPELGLQGRRDVADIALLVLDPVARGQKALFWVLCVEMWRFCRAQGITQLWVEVTPARLALYRRLGWPLVISGELRSHWGEPCYPCCMAVEAVEAEIARRAPSSAFYRQVLALAHRPGAQVLEEVPGR